MGLLFPHQKFIILICVVELLWQANFGAVAAQESDPFVELSIETLGSHTDCSLADGYQSTKCLYETPVRLRDNATGPVFSFSTKFIASMSLSPLNTREVGYGGLDRNALEGLTFAMVPYWNKSVGGDGGYMGLLNATSNGDPRAQTFAVEFDFVKSPEFSDPENGFHIGIDVNSMNSTSWVRLQGPLAGSTLWELQVWIDYDASSRTLNVSTADITGLRCPQSDAQRPGPLMVTSNYNANIVEPYNALSYQVDLSKVVNEHMYVGFTWSTLHADLLLWYPWSLRTSSPTSPAAPSAALPCFPRDYKPNVYQKYPYEYGLATLVVGLTTMAVLSGLLFCYYNRWAERRGWRFQIDPDELEAAESHEFTYKELAIATKNFHPKQALGRGGFGSVYKGFLPGNRQYVAVKRVAPDSSQGEREFLAEVMIIGKIRHRNLVRLQGWCHERGELLLVYDYMPQSSLDKHLFGPHLAAKEVELQSNCARDAQGVGKLVAATEEVVVAFPWERRFKVVVDVATALVYLHTECEERIIHRDVKAANVMLDAKFNARLGDFGLARSYNHSLLIPESTNVAGTFGYFAPELYHTGKQTEQTDVYSYGVFLLEVACGRKPIFYEDGVMMQLVDRVWEMWGASHILDAADARLAGMYDAHEMSQVLCLGLLCSHPSAELRPTMRQVLLILNGDVRMPEVSLTKPRLDHLPGIAPLDVSWGTNASSLYQTASSFREKHSSDRRTA